MFNKKKKKEEVDASKRAFFKTLAVGTVGAAGVAIAQPIENLVKVDGAFFVKSWELGKITFREYEIPENEHAIFYDVKRKGQVHIPMYNLKSTQRGIEPIWVATEENDPDGKDAYAYLSSIDDHKTKYKQKPGPNKIPGFKSEDLLEREHELICGALLYKDMKEIESGVKVFKKSRKITSVKERNPKVCYIVRVKNKPELFGVLQRTDHCLKYDGLNPYRNVG